jgi:Cytochrome P460
LLLRGAIAQLVPFGLCEDAEECRIAVRYPMAEGKAATLRNRTTGGWEFMSFPGGKPTDEKLTAERQAACAACHANRKDHDFVFSEFRK